MNSFGSAKEGNHGACPFLYQGQYYDSEIELAYNRFRYYDPKDGRYISVDPIGLSSGEFGFYNYVGDPNGWIDVFGLSDVLADNFNKGQLGETNSGIKKNTTRIPSASGKRKFRIPDGMSKNQRHLKEVKNVNKQHFSSQLKDDLAHANRGGKKGKVTLIVDTRTKLTKPLQKAINEKKIALKRRKLNSYSK